MLNPSWSLSAIQILHSVAALDPKIMLVELRKPTVVLFKNKFQIVSGIYQPKQDRKRIHICLIMFVQCEAPSYKLVYKPH